MKPPVTTQEARALMEELRRELLRQKRAVGDPRAPMRARPGQEEAFEKVEANLAKAAFILDYLEKEERRRRARKAVKAVDALLDGVIVETSDGKYDKRRGRSVYAQMPAFVLCADRRAAVAACGAAV